MTLSYFSLFICLIWGFITLNSMVMAIEEGNTQDDPSNDNVEEETNVKSTEAPGVTTTCIFPDYPEGTEVPSGKYVEVLVGFDNQGDPQTSYRAEYIVAYLLNSNPVYYIQNFSGAVYNRTVSVGESATLKYRFKPDPMLDNREYLFVVQLFYVSDDNETYLSSPYNSTITITDADSSWDAQSIFSCGSLLCVSAIFVYWVYQKYLLPHGKGTSGKSYRSKAVEGGIDWAYVPKEHRNYVRERATNNTSLDKQRNPSPKKNK